MKDLKSQTRRFCRYFLYLGREENKVETTASLLSFNKTPAAPGTLQTELKVVFSGFQSF